MKKQLLLSILIFSVTSNIALALDERQQEELNEKLLDAAYLGNYREVEQLLKNGAHVNTKDERGRTSLHHAIAKTSRIGKKDNFFDTALTLIKHNININAQDENGDTIAHFAAYHCMPNILHFIHKHNGNLTIQNKKGKTPLHRTEEQILAYEEDKEFYFQESLENCQLAADFIKQTTQKL